MSKESNVLEMVTEVEILGRTIKLYGSIEFPWFMAKDVAEWIDYSKGVNGKYQITNMVKKVDEGEKGLKSFMTLGGIQETWALTEDGLYECCMRSTKAIAKEMKNEIKKYLKSIRLTGAAIPRGNEEKMIEYYFSSFSDDVKLMMVKELQVKVDELQEFYNDLLNTEGLYHMNLVSKQLKIGRNKMLSYLRDKKILFYQDNVNVPYQRFMNQNLFAIKETPCADGKYRPVTYATKKGLEYIRKLLRKDGYYDNPITE
ncbi:phage antirepressor [Kineothrix sedimenti]|uniref:Phage antirepressor KilAC domain-containing protein n=1 Tax=Kineothrix sedimenti TaxID=3123317 RepID=A0ABZ3F2K9_9FIRM